MRKLISCFFFIVMTIASFVSQDGHSLSILERHLPNSSLRYPSFELALKMLSENQCQVLIETGTARFGKGNFWGDGGSTYVFAEWASQNGGVFYTVDIDAEALAAARRDLDPEFVDFVEFVQSDSIEFLRNFTQKIDFLYLDSYDFDINDPIPSQQHHLDEIIAVYPCLTTETIIMIDDVGLPYGGKGKLVIDYLIECGWKVVFDGYQVILRHSASSKSSL